MKTLYDVFGQRRLIVDLLLKVDSIQLNISQLIIVLQTISGMQSPSIIEILSLPSSKWTVASEQIANKEDAPNSSVIHD